VNVEEDCSMSPLFFDKKYSYISERVADTVANVAEDLVKQFITIYKKCNSGETIKNFEFIQSTFILSKSLHKQWPKAAFLIILSIFFSGGFFKNMDGKIFLQNLETLTDKE